MSDSGWAGWSDRWETPNRPRSHGFTIDVHTHIKVPETDEMARPHLTAVDDPRTLYSSEETKTLNQGYHREVHDKFTDPATRLRDMDAMGIDIQMLSIAPPQYYYPLDEDPARRVAALQNDRIAEVAGEHPDRFVPVGTLPMRHPELAVAEVERIHAIGFRSVALGADVGGADLDATKCEPIWEALAQLGVVPILHPAGFTDGARLTEYYLVNVIGMPLASTVALTRLILGGVFARHPDLRMVVVHGGGYLPFYPARTDHAFRHRPEMRGNIDRLPSEYLDQIFFDTAVFDTGLVRLLVDRFGADSVLMGSDYPFDMGQGNPVGFIEETELSSKEKALIVGENAARIFDIRNNPRGEP